MFCMEPAAVLDEPVGTEWAASLLGVTRKTVSGWVVDGSLPGAKIGPACVLLRDDVKALAAERHQGRRA